MIDLTDRWIVPGLVFLADWSVRWGVVLAVLAAWLVLRPPRQAATRYLLCLATLVAGLLLPVGPRWGDAVVPWPARELLAGGGTPAAPANAVAGLESSALGPARAFAVGEPGFQDRGWEAVPRPEPARGAAASRPPRPATAPLGAWRLAALVVTGAWAVVVLTLLLRLAGGWLMLAQLRLGAVEVGRESARLLDQCRSELGLSRPVRLAVHPAVGSPAVLAGPRPVVLVPTDWSDWPESHRRACLLHELAHLSR
jgi:hypothetical protein